LGGSATAFLLLQTSLYFLSAPVEILAQSYRDDFAIQGPGFLGSLLLLAAGSILGIIGSVLAVSRHLADIEPA
jgi:cell division transport system permease protein